MHLTNCASCSRHRPTIQLSDAVSADVNETLIYSVNTEVDVTAVAAALPVTGTDIPTVRHKENEKAR